VPPSRDELERDEILLSRSQTRSRERLRKSGGVLAAAGVTRTYRPAPLVAVTLRSRVTSFFLSYQTYANSRRDATRRSGGTGGGRGDRGRGCGKVRQYEQTCRWSVPPVQSVENHSSSLSFRLFVFVSCAPIPGQRVRAGHASSRNGAFRELPATAGARADKSLPDKS